jgi:hypothetical protein
MNALYVVAFILFVLAAICAAVDRLARWWPVLVSAGLALWVLAGPLGADID